MMKKIDDAIETITEGITKPLGTAFLAAAVVMSWDTNHHLGWAIIHGWAAPFYVIYRLLGYGGAP